MIAENLNADPDGIMEASEYHRQTGSLINGCFPRLNVSGGLRSAWPHRYFTDFRGRDDPSLPTASDGPVIPDSMVGVPATNLQDFNIAGFGVGDRLTGVRETRYKDDRNCFESFVIRSADTSVRVGGGDCNPAVHSSETCFKEGFRLVRSGRPKDGLDELRNDSTPAPSHRGSAQYSLVSSVASSCDCAVDPR